MLAQKTHSAAQYKLLSMADVGSGGLNIQDLDYTLPLNQSPKMLNMMMKNGAFGKRYGQKLYHSFSGDVISVGKYKGVMYVHVGTSIIKYQNGTETVMYTNANLTDKGVFINHNKTLYYLNPKLFIECDGSTCKAVSPYIPDICINRKPDGTYSDLVEDYNRIGAGFKNTFNGDGSSTAYHLIVPKQSDSDTSGLDATAVTALVGTVAKTEGTDFSVDRTNGIVTFNTAPASGTNNVVITAYKTYSTYVDSIMKCKYWATFGGQNSSRLFIAGNGSSTYYFSEVFDASYFPESNYAIIGNAEDDITGFGAQYNVLIVFKPKEIFALSYQFKENSSGETVTQFYSAQVNMEMGCDMPGTIQYVDNRLTWGSTQWGICTLCSTVIEDERNVRVISRNINGGYRETGLLAESNLQNAIGLIYEGRYIIAVNGNIYAWDFTNAPYSTSERITVDQAAKNLAWYKWDKINISSYTIIDRVLYYVYGPKVSIFTTACDDYGEAISCYYQTPMIDFSKFECLKTVKKVFFDVRGDTPTQINISYLTDEDPAGDADPEPIVVSTHLWGNFSWSTFGYAFISFAKTFARKCSIKKISLFGIYLSNNEEGRDMSLSGIRCEYTYVKEIK